MQIIFWNWSPSIFKLCQSRDQWDSNEWFPISKTFPFLQSSSSRKEEFEIINMYMQNMEVYYCMGKIIIISLHHITWSYLLWKVMLTFLHCLLFLSPIKVLYKQITVIKNPRNVLCWSYIFLKTAQKNALSTAIFPTFSLSIAIFVFQTSTLEPFDSNAPFQASSLSFKPSSISVTNAKPSASWS